MGYGYDGYSSYPYKKGDIMSERTPLRGGDASPQYVFMTNPNRLYRSKIRQFQCCICAGLLAVFVTAVVITVSYSVNHDIQDGVNSGQFSEEMKTLLKLTWPLEDKAEPTWSGIAEDGSAMEAAVEAGRTGLQQRDALEAASPMLQTSSPAFRGQAALSTGAKARTLARAGYVMDVASKAIAAQRGVKAGSVMARGPTLQADWMPSGACGPDPGLSYSCPASPFRSVDGSCNNLQHPLSWGVAFKPFRRVLPPDYADGVSAPRRSSDGGPLPSAREVSIEVHRPLYKDDPKFTVMLAVWGQFMDHDVTATALSQAANGSAISCCYALDKPGVRMNPECYPVRLATGDPFFDKYNVSCMEFVRSAPAPMCTFGPREQMNQVSSYLDASVVYGSMADLTNSLRSFTGGRLRMTFTPDGRELLPVSTDPNDGCNREAEKAKGRYCFMSGDPRANENLHLTTMHLLLARQHNRVADKLSQLNPKWSDERLFQEARRIVAAQIQHITYNEFLPLVIGDVLADKLELRPKKTGYYEKYNVSADATIANSFAAAAFRFAHTLIPGLMKMLANDTVSEEYVELHKMLFNPFGLYDEGYMGKAIRGAMDTHVLKADPYFSPEMTQHLFEQKPAPSAVSGPRTKGLPGLDLVSLNIQRGRDHGLRAYPYWRELCGFPKPQLFSDLNGVMDPDSVSRLSTIYKTVGDIDLYSGLVSEIPMDGSMLGPTATCLLTDQFVRLKQGDRFWYETSQQPQAFTPEQLDELRKTSLAALICDTSDDVTSSQPWVMRAVSPENPRTNCSQLARPDWQLWREEKGGAFARPGIARVTLWEGASSVRAIGPKSAAAGVSWYTGGGPRVALGSVVTGGSVTAGGSTVWSGSLPVDLKVPLFDRVATPTIATPVTGGAGWWGPVGPGAANWWGPGGAGFAHGVVWDGKVTVDASGAAHVEGTFTAPQYIHGGPLESSVEWTSGSFSVDMHVIWNNTKNSTLELSGSYSSPVLLRGPKHAAAMNELEVSNLYSQALLSGGAGAGALKAPLVLHGLYSPDRTSFRWDGNLTLVLPTLPPVIGLEQETLPQLMTLAAKGKEKEKPKKRIAVAVSVLSGSVTASKDDAAKSVTWWSGELPAPIPTHPFDKVAGLTAAVAANKKATGLPFFSTGIQWSGKLTSDGDGGAALKGSFSVPTFTHGSPLNFSVNWWSGDFSLQLRYLWNTTLDGLLEEGKQYSSPVFFRSAKTPVVAEPDLEKMEQAPLKHDPVDSTAAFVLASEEAFSLAPRVPVVLQGTYSPDGATFWWSGSAIISVPLPPPPPALPPPQPALAVAQYLAERVPLTQAVQMKTAAQDNTVTAAKLAASQVQATIAGGGLARAGRIGLTVESGWVAGADGTWWNGALPAAIPMPAFDTHPVALLGGDIDLIATPPVYSKGVIWQGSMSVISPLEASFQGTFSVPHYVHGPPLNYSLTWSKGEFSFHCKLLWNATLAGLVNPDVTYSSSIYFQGLKPAADKKVKAKGKPKAKDADADADADAPTDDVMLQLATAVDAVGDSTLSVPIILQGTYSPDKTVFYWNGNAIVSIRKTLMEEKDNQVAVPMSQASLFPHPSPFAGGGPFSPIARLGGTVTGGYVRGASASSGSITLWDGTFPAAIRVPVFDSFSYSAVMLAPFTPMVYGHGVSWSGSMTSDPSGSVSFKGTFSAPRYIHGIGPYNFSIEWWQGDFELQLQLLWNVSLDGVVSPERTFSSPIYFSGGTVTDNAQTLLSGVQMTTRDAAVQLAEESDVLAYGALRAPIILKGTYSPDRTVFLWDGKVVASLPRIGLGPLKEFAAEGGEVDGKGDDADAGKEDKEGGKGGKEDKEGGKGGKEDKEGGKGGKGGKADGKGGKADAKGGKADAKGGKADAKGGKADAKGGKGGKGGKGKFGGKGGGGGAIGLTGISGFVNANFTLSPEDLYYNDTATNTTKMRPTFLAVWSGEVPVTLPVPFFNSSLVDPQPTDPVAAAAMAISWTGSMTPGLKGGFTITGTYKLPAAVRATVDPAIAVEWSSGEFSLSASPLWKSPPPGMVSEGVTFTSPVIYRSLAPKKAGPLPPPVAAAPAAADGTPAKVPLILQGTYSPDMSHFVWSGNALLIFPFAA